MNKPQGVTELTCLTVYTEKSAPRNGIHYAYDNLWL